jgi:hypothetical protein
MSDLRDYIEAVSKKLDPSAQPHGDQEIADRMRTMVAQTP